MKYKSIAAPLISITLLFLFYKPLENSNLKLKADPLHNQLASSGGSAFAAPIGPLSTRSAARPAAVLGQAPASASPTATPAITRITSFEPPATEDPDQDLSQFISQVSDRTPGEDVPAGVHVSGVLALPILQQPKGDNAFVSTELGKATLFQSAAQNGVTGLLAHNYLSGQLFYRLTLGETVHLVYRDGAVKNYTVSEISRFQKLDPASLRSEMIELSTGRHMTTTQVFKRYYDGSDHITFQTCLENQGIPNWGLLFVVAVPTQ